MRRLECYVAGRWWSGGGEGRVIRHAATGEPLATVGSEGLDTAALVDHARRVGGPALREMGFAGRAAMLRALARHLGEHTDELHELSPSTGATRSDGTLDIEGGIGVLAVYASKGRRHLPAGNLVVDGPPERLARDGSFLGLHVRTPLEGVAVHVNAFNFPVWGMLEKLAPSLLAGVPAIVKPASPTAHLTEAAFRLIVESEILPPGAVQLVCGGIGDLFDHLDGQDLVGFTGSAATAARLRSHPGLVTHSVRFTAEADSLNAAICGLSVTVGDEALDRYVDLVATEMTVKAGQKCTAVRRALVPAPLLDVVADALAERLASVRIGDPADPDTGMGPLVGLEQREEVRRAVATLAAATDPVATPDLPADVDADVGAFLAPTLLVARDRWATEIHEVEAFGPVCTLVPYDDPDEAVALAARGGGSLVASVVTDDPDEARHLVGAVARHHGRVHVLDAACAATSTGHGSPLPHLVHGGPGRAGGGEELGGIRGVNHYLQRTAVQGSPDVLTSVTGRWVPGAARRLDRGHPFTLHFDELEVGDAVDTDGRTVTVDDIEAFAALTGDHFYAHMDDEAARASPLFDGRVAHGYFVVSAAAGLFVWPDPGPVLANYGLENLRFATPTYPGDTLRVRFTCAEKTPRPGTGYGEVRWYTEVLNQNDEVVASYDVLTMVAESGTDGT